MRHQKLKIGFLGKLILSVNFVFINFIIYISVNFNVLMKLYSILYTLCRWTYCLIFGKKYRFYCDNNLFIYDNWCTCEIFDFIFSLQMGNLNIFLELSPKLLARNSNRHKSVLHGINRMHGLKTLIKTRLT